MFCSQGWYPTWGRYNPGWELKLDDLVKVRSRVIARSVAAKQSQEINELKNMDHLPFSWWFGPALTLPGQEGRRRRQTRPGFNLPWPSSSLSAKRRGGKGIAWLKTAEARIQQKRNHRLFLARRMPFCPGRGLICPTGNPLSSEPIRNTAFFERIPFFFSTKWEMVRNFRVGCWREQIGIVEWNASE